VSGIEQPQKTEAKQIGFNPCFVGCVSGINSPFSVLFVFSAVSILVLLDVCREYFRLTCGAGWIFPFQSLFCWMCVGNLVRGCKPNRKKVVSILVLLDVCRESVLGCKYMFLKAFSPFLISLFIVSKMSKN